jgi:hypothetical protein
MGQRLCFVPSSGGGFASYGFPALCRKFRGSFLAAGSGSGCLRGWRSQRIAYFAGRYSGNHDCRADRVGGALLSLGSVWHNAYVCPQRARVKGPLFQNRALPRERIARHNIVLADGQKSGQPCLTRRRLVSEEVSADPSPNARVIGRPVHPNQSPGTHPRRRRAEGGSAAARPGAPAQDRPRRRCAS